MYCSVSQIMRGGRFGYSNFLIRLERLQRNSDNVGYKSRCRSRTERGKKVKGKAVPLQVWTGPEGSRKLRLPDFVTTAQDGGKVVSLTHRPPLPPGNTPGTHFC